MRLSVKLALINIRRYPLRALGNAVCLLLFGFAVISSVMFTRSLSDVLAEVLRLRSSGNTVIVDRDIGELERVASHPDILEACPRYWTLSVQQLIRIEGVGEFDVSLEYDTSPDIKTLIPETYLEEFRAVGGGDFIVAGRLPGRSGEMIICESWFEEARIQNYEDVFNKPTSFLVDVFVDGSEKYTLMSDLKIVGAFSKEFMQISALQGHIDWANYAFLLDSECEYRFITAFCSVDKIDGVYDDFCARYGEENVVKSVLVSGAIDKLSGLRLFIGNLMYLAAAAIAAIYLLARFVIMSNYLKEKALFVTAADAFGCGRAHIFGAFAFENIVLLIPMAAACVPLAGEFCKMIFRIISAYIGVEFNAVIDSGAMLAAAAIMIAVELIIPIAGLLPIRQKGNN